MATTVTTVEFGTIHHYSSLEENSKAFCPVLGTDTKKKKKKNQRYVNYDIFM